MQHARDNPDFYGRQYAQRDLAWEVVDEDEKGKPPGWAAFTNQPTLKIPTDGHVFASKRIHC